MSISALILGLVQGLTEFLPVSSSGHLVLTGNLLDYDSHGLWLEMVVHLATTLVVLVYFRKRFLAVAQGVFKDQPTRRLIGMLAVSFTVTSLIGLLLSSVIAASFESPPVAAVMLLLTGTALASIKFIPPDHNTSSLFSVTWKAAIIVGIAQGLAIFPGISRSGFTIIAGLWSGLDRNSAAEFSFMLSVPTILAASAFTMIRDPDFSGADFSGLLLAGVFAFLSGLVAIHWLMRWLRQGRLDRFALYCWLIGGGFLLLWGFNVW